MKKNNRVLIYPLLIMGFVLIFASSCKKDSSTEKVPVLTTTAISSITQTTATSGGNVTSDEGSTITARGVCWSTSQKPVIAGSKTTDGTGVGAFTSAITDLTANTPYYVRAYATSSAGTGYGNEILFTSAAIPPLVIGQSYQGGIVAYILQSGDPGYISGQTHGLIAAPSDQSTGILWYDGTNVTGATAVEIGKGNANTTTIVASQGTGNYAARLCYDLVIGDYSDWYLPSINELNKLYGNKTAIGGFNSSEYWSSTESPNSDTNAWGLDFATGDSGDWLKTDVYRVRAVRSF